MHESIVDERKESGGSLSKVNVAYTYDDLDRLTREDSEVDAGSAAARANADFAIDYTYDLVGNRTKKQIDSDGDNIIDDAVTYVYNTKDRLTTETLNPGPSSVVTTYGYDDNGFMTSKSTDGGDSYTFTPDVQDRLYKAETVRTEGGSSVELTTDYLYDHSGIRVRATQTVYEIDAVPVTPPLDDTVYLVDPANPTGYAQVFEERNASLSPQMTYTIGDDVITQNDNSDTYQLMYDGHGSTRLLTDDGELIAARYDYEAYGTNTAGNTDITTPAKTNYQYTGEQFDTATQHYYLRARYNDTTTGRFNRLDPFTGDTFDPQSLHKYGYVHADPTNLNDASGFGATLFGTLATTVVYSIFIAIGLEIISIGVDASRGRPPSVMEIATRLGIAALIGALTGLVGIIVGRLLTAVANKLVVGLVTGFASGATAQSISELIAWMRGRPVNVRDSAGRIFKAAFAGAIFGAILAKLSPLFKSRGPVGGELKGGPGGAAPQELNVITFTKLVTAVTTQQKAIQVGLGISGGLGSNFIVELLNS